MIVVVVIIVHVVVWVLVAGAAWAADIVHVELFVHLGHDQIENWDDVGRVVLDLAVKHLIELENVVTVDVQTVAIKLAHLSQTLDIVRSLLVSFIIVIIVVLNLLKVVDEVLEFHLYIARVDIGSPEHLRVTAHFIGPSQLVLIEHARGAGLVIGQHLVGPVWVEGRLVQQTIHVQEAALLLEVRHQSRGVQHSIAW